MNAYSAVAAVSDRRRRSEIDATIYVALYRWSFVEEHIMNRFLTGLMVVVAAVILTPLAFGQADAEGSKDYPGISRMPGYYIADYSEIPFDAYKFKIAVTNTWKEESVEGRRINIRYNLKDGAQ